MLEIEHIIYIARKLHWSRDEIGQLSPSQAIAVYNELAYQESVDEWRAQHSLASILAAIYNTIPKKSGHAKQASDFLNSEEPHRINEKKLNQTDKRASEAGIVLPSK